MADAEEYEDVPKGVRPQPAGISIPLQPEDIKQLDLYGAHSRLLDECESKIRIAKAKIAEQSQAEQKKLGAEIKKIREYFETAIATTTEKIVAAERAIGSDLDAALQTVQACKREFKATEHKLNTEIVRLSILNHGDPDQKRAERTKKIVSATTAVLNKALPRLVRAPDLTVKYDALCEKVLAASLYSVREKKSSFEDCTLTPEKMNKKGEDYYYGRNGVAKDYKDAVKWYRKAADQGNAHGQCQLGHCYRDGEGVAQDYEEAVKWWRKAADQGHADGQYNLGHCYGDGC